MFERFTSRARQVIVFAQGEARTHERIGTDHILLGLMREQEGLAARVLASFDVTSEQVRAEVLQTLGPGEEPAGGLRQIPFSPEAKMVLQHSLREALSLGHNYIGTEHLLLGLLREQDGAGAKILTGHGVDRAKARDQIVLMTSARGGRVESPGGPTPGEVAPGDAKPGGAKPGAAPPGEAANEGEA